MVPQSARNHGQNRPAKIREALKLVFQTGPRNQPWVSSFDWLFDLRDAAVHAGEKPTAPEPHPVLGHTSRENASYAMESAERAVDLAISVFRWRIDHPRNISADWAAAMRPLVEQLEGSRTGTA